MVETILKKLFENCEELKVNWNKIYALSLRHIYLIKGSFPRILDLIYWPTIQIFLWGFISKFFTLKPVIIITLLELY